jgi:protein ImuB
VGAAWAIAHYGHFARLPSGWGGRAAIIPPGRQAEALAQLPVEALRLPSAMLATLHELDVRRVDELRKLPRASLPSRFGPRVIECLDQALGHLPETITPQRAPEPIRADWLLEHPTSDRRAVKSIVKKLIEQVAARLERRQEGAQQLVCTLQIAGHDPVELAVGLVHPSASAAHLCDLVCMQLERTAVPGEVAGVNVSAVLIAPLDSHQGNMFDIGTSRDHWKQLAMLINRMTSRLGKHAVLRVWLTEDAQPERVPGYGEAVGKKEGATDYRLRTTGKRKDANSSFPEPVACSLKPSLRPLLLLPQPLPVRVVSVVPDGPPIRFAWDGCEHVVARSWGPERIATGWWRSDPIARDYYRVETTAGQRFWMFRCLDGGDWFLHGIFE